MTTISFNTTNVLSLDNIGKLYRIDVPLSEGTGPGEALVYSTASITNGKAAPASAIYLKNDDPEKSYFSIDRTGNKSLSLVASGNSGSMNLSASRSRILDTDYAKETTNLAKAQIIQQAATAMLAQANQSAQSVLALLK